MNESPLGVQIEVLNARRKGKQMNLLKFIKNYLFGNIEKTEPEPLAPINDHRALPTCIDDFKECHFKLLRRLDKHPVKEPFSGIITIEIDIPNFIPILQNLNLIIVASYEDSVCFTKNESLKAILKKLGLKTSGNKEELVRRILDDASVLHVKNLEEYSDCYVLTPLGRQAVNESYDRFKQLNQEFFKTCIDMIMNLELPQAYRKICKRNAEMPLPPGLGVDWIALYKKGLSNSLEKLYNENLKNSDNKLLMACAIYCNMSGDALREVYSNITSLYDTNIVNLDALRRESSALSENRNFLSYKDCGLERYQFLATLDAKTCPICGKLDGKIFYVKDKQIGINCPPMHDGCRCTAVAVIDEKYWEGHQRIAMNPITNRNYYIPRTMYWSEWKNTFKE